MLKYGTIHIFNTTQNIEVITKENNSQIPFSAVTNLNSFVNEIISHKPENMVIENTSVFHVIHIFRGFRITYIGTGKNTSFNVNFEDVNQTIFDSFINTLEEKYNTYVV